MWRVPVLAAALRKVSSCMAGNGVLAMSRRVPHSVRAGAEGRFLSGKHHGAGIPGGKWSAMAGISERLSKQLARMGAKEKIEKEAENGDVKAMLLMGAMYSMGRLVEEDMAASVRWYAKAANEGNGEANLAMAVMTRQGLGGIQVDDVKAAMYLEVAVKEGVTQAMGELGLMLSSGEGVARDDARAVSLLEQASQAGDLRASYNLGMLHSMGRAGKVKSRAHELVRAAADKGLPDAQHSLAMWYQVGSEAHGLKADERKSAQWGRKAAEGGHPTAMHNLGLRLLAGEGGERVDAKQAKQWLEKSAAAGVTESWVALGNELISEGNKEGGLGMFEKAATQGHTGAMFNLAVCYDAALGTPQDLTKAFEWLVKSADGGDMQAQWFLGEALLKGRGCQPDPPLGERWQAKARAAGFESPPPQGAQ